ncbi:MAG: hypothetical protein ABR544_10365 [Gammaproteobacteria bacterium]
MHASEDSYDDDAGTLVLQDEADARATDLAGGMDAMDRKDYGYRMKARRRLEQLREERELARLLRTGFDQ